MKNQAKEDLISVIIPIYKMEKFIERCLNSICKSSYCNLEIICVDDGSPDKSIDIVKAIQKKDDRIVIVQNPQNLGLFRARVEGLKAAHGDYLCFVDADDFVGVDWFRLLHKKIVQEQSDMVLGNTVNVDEHNRFFYYNNYRSLNESHTRLTGENVLKALLEQEGSNFLWHTVWNKLYCKKLVQKCLPYFQRIDFHLIMGEDILFSTIFYSVAQSLSFANVDAYFYYRHSEASTSNSLPPEKVIKNVNDIGNVFKQCKQFLIEYNEKLFRKYENYYIGFVKRYHRIWSGNVWGQSKHNQRTIDAMEQAFGEKTVIPPRPREFYFYELCSPWSPKIEDIKNQLASEDVKVVSFDIYDTLILRPFYDPTDLYVFVAKFAHKLLPTIPEHLLVDSRKRAEELVREKFAKTKLSWEDVTLSEIYQEFAQLLQVDQETCNKIKQEENRLELKFCSERKLGKEIYEYVQHLGKRIVITSDMYLERPIVEKVLEQNGYTGYENLFLSSERRALKSTGSLFDVVIRETQEKPKFILHVGDNWNVDKVIAEQKQMQTVFFPKALETMENIMQDIHAGEDLTFYRFRGQDVAERTFFRKDLATRCMTALVANKWFDNFNAGFHPDSNYNGDTYHTGYATMGPHFWALANWIRKTALENGYKKIVFLARDGLLLKQVFDYLCKKTNTDLKSDYFYASRKALMPYGIKCARDLQFIYEYFDLNEKKHTPLMLLKLLAPILKPLDAQTEKLYRKDGIMLDKALLNKKEFFAFVEAVEKYSFDQKKCDENRRKIADAFCEEFPEHTATFDIGYSGKLQNIICDLAGRPVDAFFIHDNGYFTQTLAQDKFKIHRFYDFTPTVTAIVREFFISAPEPSCTGYEVKEGKLVPQFEDKQIHYDSAYALREFQKGTFEFCRDYIDTFLDYLEEMPYRNFEASQPFEHYLLYASPFDRWAFSNSNEEDLLYSGYQSKSIVEIWDWHLNEARWHGIHDYPPHPTDPALIYDIVTFPRRKRALFFLLFDKQKFKEKLRNNLRRRK